MWRSLVARYLGEVEVPGSNPGIPTIGGYSSEGEHHLDTVGAIGSIPISRTKSCGEMSELVEGARLEIV
jgi:hypothetical protein